MGAEGGQAVAGAEQVTDPGGHAGDVSRPEQISVDAVLDRLRGAVDVRRDDRQARGDRFQKDARKPLPERRVEEEVRRAQEIRDLVARGKISDLVARYL